LLQRTQMLTFVKEAKFKVCAIFPRDVPAWGTCLHSWKVHHNHTKEDGFELDNNTPHDFQPLEVRFSRPSRTCNTKWWWILWLSSKRHYFLPSFYLFLVIIFHMLLESLWIFANFN
jgi:hypothetical protein